MAHAAVRDNAMAHAAIEESLQAFVLTLTEVETDVLGEIRRGLGMVPSKIRCRVINDGVKPMAIESVLTINHPTGTLHDVGVRRPAHPYGKYKW